MTTDDIRHQYETALAMLKGVIQETDNATWLNDGMKHRCAAWRIAYHALFYANSYGSPDEASTRHWPKEEVNRRILGQTPWPPHEEYEPEGSYSRQELAEFADFVKAQIPGYLQDFKPDAPWWPSWYNQTRLGFHMTNLRHIHQHMGQLIERNGGSDVGWLGM